MLPRTPTDGARPRRRADLEAHPTNEETLQFCHRSFHPFIHSVRNSVVGCYVFLLELPHSGRYTAYNAIMTAFKQALNRFRKQQQQSGDPQPDDWIDFRTNDERVIQLNDTTWTLRDFPGFLFVPGGVPHPEKLAKEALLEYCEPPHVTNLAKETTNCHWSHYRETGIWRPSWATCGYHYDWTARAYHRDRHSLFPEALAELGRTFGLERAEACIVNYYHSNSRMVHG